MFTINTFLRGIRILALFALLVTTFFAMPVSAEGDGLVITVDRLHGLGVGLKIVFPENISEDLGVFMNKKKMNCDLVAPDTLYCTGNLRPNEMGFLTFYDTASEAVIGKATVTGPDKIEFGDPEPVICFFKGPIGLFGHNFCPD